MSNTLWSDHVQGVWTLFLSRQLRFDDLFFEQYEKAFRLDKDKPLKLLEIGCGPGALAEALRRRYPNAEIWAIDRDSRFIRFAQENVSGVTFAEGDAEALPFPDGFFDVTISYTVQEHIEPAAFWGEQRRVLKDGGVCLCLSARRGVSCRAACLAETPEEKAFWAAAPDTQESLEAYGVCRYPMTEAQLPAAMEENGFRDVSVSYAAADLTPDDKRFSAAQAERMIEAERQNDLEAVASMHRADAQAVVDAVNAKYDERLRLYRAGIRQWDTAVSLTLILRGVKKS